MYYHQVIQQSDFHKFTEVIVKEIQDHCKKKHWQIVQRDEVPDNFKVLPLVWSTKRKCDLVSRESIKYKLQLNIQGGK